MSTTDPAPGTPARRRPWLLAAGVMLAVGLALAYLVASPVGQGAIGRRMAALRRAGYPATAADLNQPPAPPERNAAVLYIRATASVRQLDKAWRRADGREPAGAGKLLEQYSETFGLLSQAGERPICWWPGDYGQGFAPAFERYADMMGVSRVLGCRAVYRTRHNYPAGAYADIATALRMCRHLRRQPCVAGHYVRQFCLMTALGSLGEVAAAAPPTAGQTATLWPLLDPEEARAGLRHALIGERAMAVTLWQQGHARPQLYIRAGQGAWYAAALATLGRPLLDHDFARVVDAYDTLVDMQRLSGRAYDTALDNLEREVHRQRFYVPAVAEVFNDSYGAARWEADGEAASCVMARWALALARYRAVHGRYPAALSEARPLAPGEPGLDPFTGKLPVYKRVAAGYQMYCLGRNGRDEGGMRYSDPGAPAGADDWSWQRLQGRWAR